MTFLDKNRDKFIEDLRGLLMIPSVSANHAEVERALDYVLELAQGMGMSTRKAAGGAVGIIQVCPEKEGRDETLGILAHVDVVDPGDISLWENPPFGGTISGERIIGRGALDDKGPLVVCLYALKGVMENGRPLTKKVQIVIGTQEETEWTDMEEYAKTSSLPDYGFTPDGAFPICNVEKGCYDIALEFPLGGENAGEEQGGVYLTSLTAGTATNVVPGTCSATLSDGRTLCVKGKAVHSCQPEKGENAIFNMERELSVLGVSNNRLLELLRMIKEKLGDVHGGGLGLAGGSQYYNGEFVHKNVLSPVIIEMDNGLVRIRVNVRFAYTTEPKQITEVFEALCMENGGRIAECSILPAVYVSREEPFLTKLAEAYEEETAFKNDFTLGYGGSYSKVMPKVVSWGPILPGMEDTCHEENEYIKIDDLMTTAHIYYSAISKIAQSEQSFL